jgi:hypothetical protein
MHNFSIKYVEWPGNLWPKDIAEIKNEKERDAPNVGPG